MNNAAITDSATGHPDEFPYTRFQRIRTIKRSVLGVIGMMLACAFLSHFVTLAEPSHGGYKHLMQISFSLAGIAFVLSCYYAFYRSTKWEVGVGLCVLIATSMLMVFAT